MSELPKRDNRATMRIRVFPVSIFTNVFDIYNNASCTS